MRANFLQEVPARTKLQEDDAMHSLSVSQMGNFQDAINRNPPLREVVESTLVRTHLFGNPFKVNKKMMMIDEADIDFGGGSVGNGSATSANVGVASASGGRGTKRSATVAALDPVRGIAAKRKRGPIPKDFVYRPSSALGEESCFFIYKSVVRFNERLDYLFAEPSKPRTLNDLFP
jgi:integrator complex subunit 6